MQYSFAVMYKTLSEKSMVSRNQMWTKAVPKKVSTMFLILDGNSIHDAHEYWPIGLFG